MLEIDESGESKLVHEKTTRAIIGAAFEVQVQYKGVVVGDYDADLIVDGCVAVEIKVAPQCDKRDEAQLLNELKATGLKVGMLVNFGRNKLEYKRLVF